MLFKSRKIKASPKKCKFLHIWSSFLVLGNWMEKKLDKIVSILIYTISSQNLDI